jgi:hypothetical protein
MADVAGFLSCCAVQELGTYLGAVGNGESAGQALQEADSALSLNGAPSAGRHLLQVSTLTHVLLA